MSTIDGGINWSVQYLPAVFNAVFFIDENTGFLAGEYGKAYKTIDGGLNWSKLTTGTTEDLEDVTFTDSNTGWMVGWDGTIISTLNGGASWTNQSVSTGMNFYSVNMLSSSAGCICGDGGAILGTAPVTGLTDWRAYNGKEYARLLPVYPNPSGGSTTIKYEILKESFISLELIDQFGKVLKVLIQNQLKSPGIYSVTLSETGRLPSGLYFCRLQSCGPVESQKIIILK